MDKESSMWTVKYLETLKKIVNQMFEIKQNTHTQTLRFDVYPMVTSSFFFN